MSPPSGRGAGTDARRTSGDVRFTRGRPYTCEEAREYRVCTWLRRKSPIWHGLSDVSAWSKNRKCTRRNCSAIKLNYVAGIKRKLNGQDDVNPHCPRRKVGHSSGKPITSFPEYLPVQRDRRRQVQLLGMHFDTPPTPLRVPSFDFQARP